MFPELLNRAARVNYEHNVHSTWRLGRPAILSAKARCPQRSSAMMRGAVQGGPRSMNTLQVGDWVQSDTGAAGTIMVISDNGRRAFVEVAHGTLGAGLVSFPVTRLHKAELPNPAN